MRNKPTLSCWTFIRQRRYKNYQKISNKTSKNLSVISSTRITSESTNPSFTQTKIFSLPQVLMRLGEEKLNTIFQWVEADGNERDMINCLVLAGHWHHIYPVRNTKFNVSIHCKIWRTALRSLQLMAVFPTSLISRNSLHRIFPSWSSIVFYIWITWRMDKEIFKR